jgi:drug/metabolite transporter (DMT)-like permease
MHFPAAPVWALLIGASMWGVLWYPYRLLAHAGLDGIWATLLTYGLAFAAGIVVFPRHARSLFPLHPLAILMAAAIGWSNLAYVMGVLEGQVMRVLLLFYLAPLWTVPLARLVLRERLEGRGLLVMALAFAGAMTMLWHPELGFPWPAERAEWLGLAAGLLFALGNVLVRRLAHLSDPAKSIAIWAGVAFAAGVHLVQSDTTAAAAWSAARTSAPLVIGIGATLFAMSLAIQYGLSRLPANRAIVILLFELVVAAFAAYGLADETLRPQDWIGGALIVAASLASGAIKARRDA